MQSPAKLARESRERAQARATQAPADAQTPVSPYADATEPVHIPGTSKVAVVVRDMRSDALYACSRNVSGNGRAARVHLDAIDALGYVHSEDRDTLAECETVQSLIAEAVAKAAKPAPETPKPKTTAKKASASK